MPVTVEWDNDTQTRIRYVLDGKWSLDELYQGMQKGYSLMDARADTSVDVIVDALASKGIPKDLNSISNYVDRNRRKNLGHVVIVSDNMLITALANLLKRVSKNQPSWAFAETNDEAMQILERLESNSS